MKPALLKKREVAEYLSVCTKTIDRWVDRGALKALKIGRSVRFEASEVERFIESKRTA